MVCPGDTHTPILASSLFDMPVKCCHFSKNCDCTALPGPPARKESRRLTPSDSFRAIGRDFSRDMMDRRELKRWETFQFTRSRMSSEHGTGIFQNLRKILRIRTVLRHTPNPPPRVLMATPARNDEFKANGYSFRPRISVPLRAESYGMGGYAVGESGTVSGCLSVACQYTTACSLLHWSRDEVRAHQ
jgi:hypothetical protein